MVVNSTQIRDLGTTTENLGLIYEVGTAVEVEDAGGTQQDFIYLPFRETAITPAARVVNNVVIASGDPILTAPTEGATPFSQVRLSDTADSTTLTPGIAVLSVNNGGATVTLATNPLGSGTETVTFSSSAGPATIWIVRLAILASAVNTARVTCTLYRASGLLGTDEFTSANLDANGEINTDVATEVGPVEDLTDIDAILTRSGLDRT